MTPVDQEFLHKPEINQHGDCMRACIASLLDLPIVDVPNFAQLDADGEGNYWILLAEFCRQRGYSFVTMQGRFVWANDAIYHIIDGPSPRNPNGHHAVVGLNGRIFFDPHPSRAGLAGGPSDWKFNLLVHAAQQEAAGADVDAIVTRLYRRFKDWSERGFGPDDVTWCEVKADIQAMIAASIPSPAPLQSDHSEHILNMVKAAPQTWTAEQLEQVQRDAAVIRSNIRPAPMADAPQAAVPMEREEK